MAALSLTEIRDAFAGDDTTGVVQQSSAPVQQLPDHAKKSNPVNVRLVADQAPAPQRSRRKHSSRKAPKPDAHVTGSDDRQHLMRVTNNALTLTAGLAFHSGVISCLNHYFEQNGVTVFNQLCMRLIYPLVTILVIWALRHL